MDTDFWSDLVDNDGGPGMALAWLLQRHRQPGPFGKILHFGSDCEGDPVQFWVASFRRTALPLAARGRGWDVSSPRLHPALFVEQDRTVRLGWAHRGWSCEYGNCYRPCDTDEIPGDVRAIMHGALAPPNRRAEPSSDRA